MDRIDHLLEVGDLVEIRAAQVAALLAVGAHVRDGVQLDRRDRSVLLYPDLIVLLRGPAAVHADEVIFPGEFELYWLASDFSQDRRHEVVVLGLIFVAETGAHVLADDPNLAEGQVEIFGDVRARVRDALSGSPD